MYKTKIGTAGVLYNDVHETLYNNVVWSITYPLRENLCFPC